MSGTHREILVPKHSVEVPHQLAGLFDLLGVMLDQNTPIRKTARCESSTDPVTGYKAADYHTTPLSGILDIDLVSKVRRYSNPGMTKPAGLLENIPTVAATEVIFSRGRTLPQAHIGFSEIHRTHEPANSLLSYYGIAPSAWEFGFSLVKSGASQEDHTYTFGANSIGQVASCGSRGFELVSGDAVDLSQAAEMLQRARDILIAPLTA